MSLMAFMETMGTSNIAVVAAFFIGLMTAISPCPLATNITAVAYIAKKLENPKHTLLSGALYMLGRALTYTLIASIIVYAGLSAESIGRFLQTYGPKLLGPVLILIGIVMLELLTFKGVKGGAWFESLKLRLAEKGHLGSFLLGALLALAFCPFSGVLYFGMLIPLALATKDAVLTPLVFGIATGLPVMIAAVLLASGTEALGKALHKTRIIERWFRKGVGIVFIIVGAYYLITAIF